MKSSDFHPFSYGNPYNACWDFSNVNQSHRIKFSTPLILEHFTHENKSFQQIHDVSLINVNCIKISVNTSGLHNPVKKLLKPQSGFDIHYRP